MNEKENDTPSPQAGKKDATTGGLTPLPRGSFPSVPDSDPLFKRGFVIGGRGFNRPRSQKESKEQGGRGHR
jgi:hypothetical protein